MPTPDIHAASLAAFPLPMADHAEMNPGMRHRWADDVIHHFEQQTHLFAETIMAARYGYGELKAFRETPAVKDGGRDARIEYVSPTGMRTVIGITNLQGGMVELFERFGSERGRCVSRFATGADKNDILAHAMRTLYTRLDPHLHRVDEILRKARAAIPVPKVA